MGIPDRSLSDLIRKVRSWMGGELRRSSRQFWMPDGSSRLCYECDSCFSFLNRRHHCRSCGRLFCGKCMQNDSVLGDDGERVKFCKFCFRAIGQEAMADEYDCRLDYPLLTQAFGYSDDELGSCRSFRSESLVGFLEAQQGFSSPLAAASSSTASSLDPLSPISLRRSVIRYLTLFFPFDVIYDSLYIVVILLCYIITKRRMLYHDVCDSWSSFSM